MYLSPHLELAKTYWEKWLRPGDIAVDATAGNGRDSLFLAKLSISALFVFDIQSTAIAKTQKYLQDYLQKVTFYCRSHVDIDQVVLPKPPRLVVYNLGYLPGGDKTLTTRTETTLASVKAALSILDFDGAISITCYPGHEEGAREEKALIDFFISLPPSMWSIQHHRWDERPRLPSLFWITRIVKSEPTPCLSHNIKTSTDNFSSA